MADLYYSLEKRLESYGREYFYLLKDFRLSGDINIFSELYNKLLELKDEVNEFPDADRSFELSQDIDSICNAIDLIPYTP